MKSALQQRFRCQLSGLYRTPLMHVQLWRMHETVDFLPEEHLRPLVPPGAFLARSGQYFSLYKYLILLPITIAAV